MEPVRELFWVRVGESVWQDSIAGTLAPTIAKLRNREKRSPFSNSVKFTARAHSSDGHPLQVRQNGPVVLSEERSLRSVTVRMFANDAETAGFQL
jgi:hypothetical protein